MAPIDTAMKVFIHPGFGKTGTTTLQENFFARHPAILSIGRPYSGQAAEIAETMLLPDGVGFDPTRLRTLVERTLAERQRPGQGCIVWSDEKLTSNAYLRQGIAGRIKALFPEARILFTIRNQLRALESFYANHGRKLKKVPNPYPGRLVSLEDWLEFAFVTRQTSYLGLIDYANSIGIYESVFGRENVHVLLFEDMIQHKEEFADRLSGLLGIEAAPSRKLFMSKQRNPRDSRRLLRYSAFRERFLPGVKFSTILPGGRKLHRSLLAYLSSGDRIAAAIPESWEPRLADLYRAGNAKLIEQRGLPLEKYGYPA